MLLLTAMAGGMGWGTRGQYGRESREMGAMIAGLRVSVVWLSSTDRFRLNFGVRGVSEKMV